jgi:hypothetical protein
MNLLRRDRYLQAPWNNQTGSGGEWGSGGGEAEERQADGEGDRIEREQAGAEHSWAGITRAGGARRSGFLSGCNLQIPPDRFHDLPSFNRFVVGA